MNEELQSKLAEIIGSLADQVQTATDAGVDFAKEQLPIVAREVLTLALVESAVGMAIGIGLFIAGAVWCMVFRKKVRAEWARVAEVEAKHGYHYGNNDKATLLSLARWLPFSALAIAGTVVFCIYAAMIAKPLVAPRVYLIEWCADRLK